MAEIESFDFSYGQSVGNLYLSRHPGIGASPKDETVTATANDPLATELAAYNRAFSELELPWHWDAATLSQLKSIATDSDVVGAYVERSQAHLLRAYEKAFLRELVCAARDRCQQETLSTAA